MHPSASLLLAGSVLGLAIKTSFTSIVHRFDLAPVLPFLLVAENTQKMLNHLVVEPGWVKTLPWEPQTFPMTQ